MASAAAWQTLVVPASWGEFQASGNHNEPLQCCAPVPGRAGRLLLAVANAEGSYYPYMQAWLKGRRDG
jgi:hypothetical protein